MVAEPNQTVVPRGTSRLVENALEFCPRFCRRRVSGRRAADTSSGDGDHQLMGFSMSRATSVHTGAGRDEHSRTPRHRRSTRAADVADAANAAADAAVATRRRPGRAAGALRADRDGATAGRGGGGRAVRVASAVGGGTNADTVDRSTLDRCGLDWFAPDWSELDRCECCRWIQRCSTWPPTSAPTRGVEVPHRCGGDQRFRSRRTRRRPRRGVDRRRRGERRRA